MNLFKMNDLTVVEIMDLLDRARFFENNPKAKISEECTMATLFFEPSTRTQYSFEKAMHDLGIRVTSFHAESSSLTKGESLYDTVKTFEALGYDGLVIRHPKNEYFSDLASIGIPIINGGDGSGNHPSQCLLDLYTIAKEFNTFNNLNIVIVGDILHSRVAKSNYEALTRLGANVRMSGPLSMQSDDYPYVSLDECIHEVDVVMLLRVQKERHDTNSAVIDGYLEQYGLSIERYEKLKEGAIVMHPAPMNRGVEIANEVVEASKSRIFSQMTNGVHMRKAIIEKVLTYVAN